MAIKLDSIAQIPKDILARLASFKTDFEMHNSWDQISKIPTMRQIVTELDEFCVGEGVTGYHYTRAQLELIKRDGLILMTGEQRRRKFLEDYGHLFTASQREWIVKQYNDYFSPNCNRSRDHKIFFNFTLAALRGRGAEDLLTYYGGEVVYFPICDNPEIGAVLKTIGQPLLVECVLHAADLTTFCEYPWGRIWLTSYHATLNPGAYRWDQDGFQTKSVLPSQIHRIITLQPPFANKTLAEGF